MTARIDDHIARHPTASFILTWVVLPNLPFLFLWLHGGPPRYGAVFLFYSVGIFFGKAPFALRVLAYTVAMTYDLLVITSNIFNLRVTKIFETLDYYDKISPAESGEYLGLAIVIVLCAALALFLSFRTRNADFSFYAVTAAALLVCAIDFSLQHTYRYSFGKHLRARADFSSAEQQVGLLNVIEKFGDRNVLVVMVESWPLFESATRREALVAPLINEKTLSRYEISSGETPYYGSTTNAEIREFCGRWDDYDPYLASLSEECLPSLLRKRHGYETLAFHGFSELFFDRDRWYPNIGFDRSYFLEQLVEPTSSFCGHVFEGLCDMDVAEVVSRTMLEKERSTLVYWLTLNSHLPIHPDSPQNYYDCESEPYPFDSQKLCRNANIVSDVMAVVERVAIDSREGAEPIILVVGDHPPPYWTRQERNQYSSNGVPWVMLTPRS